MNTFSSSKTTFQVEPIGEFYYESDHLALKEERRGDYKTLLQVLAVLEAQKVTTASTPGAGVVTFPCPRCKQ